VNAGAVGGIHCQHKETGHVKETSGWGERKARNNSRFGKPKARKDRRAPHTVWTPSYDVQYIKVGSILVKDERRSLRKEKLDELRESIAIIGLRNPITVGFDPDSGWDRKYPLIDGLHRLEVFKERGEATIPAFVMKGDQRLTRLWQIDANLRRADLTALERADAVTERVRLVQELVKDGQIAQPGGKQPSDKGFSKTAKELGSTRESVRRSETIAGMSPEAKAAARSAEIDDNESALLKVAKEPPEKQVDKVKELQAQKDSTQRGRKQLSAKDNKALQNLVGLWKNARSLRKSFLAASEGVSNKFIAHMRHDRQGESP
jgi:ParB/RepB/Spo0J family partition protein